MPELPEVETIARDLHPRLTGARIRSVEITHPDVLDAPPDAFRRALSGRTIQAVERRGKNVVLVLDDDARLVVNLGMTGRLVLDDAPAAEALRHVAVRFRLEDDRSLLYDDTRRFGLLEIFPLADWNRRTEELGLEPLGDAFTPEALHGMTRRTRVPIRNFLLDQYRVAGVGNIYALEALFRAGIRPTRRGRTITRAEATRLRDSLRSVLQEAIRHRGTTFSDYRDASGESGAFQSLLKVYGREGDPCVQCGSPIKRRVLTNRSVFYCPSCQR
ncbi:MAG TPA: bifunctional DNA-formamidopyrimidine glycosylase/DNA-(apurinic or apyrimidinic site) lyase [Longimicrobiales bacterium]|nr:bifunctional DNA-formamidopyrimidine glycosylase/DNA-(apurinic or apyrimidinic site) lyase [Longimicrobiales bacterium]